MQSAACSTRITPLTKHRIVTMVTGQDTVTSFSPKSSPETLFIHSIAEKTEESTSPYLISSAIGITSLLEAGTNVGVTPVHYLKWWVGVTIFSWCSWQHGTNPMPVQRWSTDNTGQCFLLRQCVHIVYSLTSPQCRLSVGQRHMQWPDIGTMPHKPAILLGQWWADVV